MSQEIIGNAPIIGKAAAQGYGIRDFAPRRIMNDFEKGIRKFRSIFPQEMNVSNRSGSWSSNSVQRGRE